MYVCICVCACAERDVSAVKEQQVELDRATAAAESESTRIHTLITEAERYRPESLSHCCAVASVQCTDTIHHSATMV